jgi:hypothetical protein
MGSDDATSASMSTIEINASLLAEARARLPVYHATATDGVWYVPHGGLAAFIPPSVELPRVKVRVLRAPSAATAHLDALPVLQAHATAPGSVPNAVSNRAAAGAGGARAAGISGRRLTSDAPLADR